MFLTVEKKLFNKFHHGVLTITCPSLPSFARDNRKYFQYLNIVFHNKSGPLSVADPDLQIRGRFGHPDPEIRGEGPGLKKKLFSALRTSVWSENKGGGPGPQAPPLDPPLIDCFWNSIDRKTSFTFLKRYQIAPFNPLERYRIVSPEGRFAWWQFAQTKSISLMSGAHNPERTTLILGLCQGVFTDQFIFIHI